jgi:hypothetical protein
MWRTNGIYLGESDAAKRGQDLAGIKNALKAAGPCKRRRHRLFKKRSKAPNALKTQKFWTV